MLKYFLLLYLLHNAFGIDNYFCNFKCKSQHTVCKRKSCGLSKACGRDAKALPLTDANRQWVLDAHNNKRNQLALGKDTAGGNGQAANMRALSYDKELEFVAQCWSNACKEGGTDAHDTCRSTTKFSYAGQNMFMSGSTANEDYSKNEWLSAAVDNWYAEIQYTNAAEIDHFRGATGQAIGHFTQVVWAETTHVGCGRTSLKSGDFNNVYIYCNYGKGGNVGNTPVYLRGPPCSQCGSNQCNSKYPGLCGNIASLSEDKWQPPYGMRTSGLRLQSSLYIIAVFIIISYFI